MERLHHLCTKTAPWRQGVRLPDVTRHIPRPRVKKEAVKKSLDRKKTLCRSWRHCARTGCGGKTVRHL